MKHGLPGVSVIVPAHNAAATLEQCLRSVAGASCRPREVRVVDDGSEDSTAAIARGLGGRVITLAPAQGPAAARNAGARAAAGDILFFVDADTAMRPDTIARAAAHFSDPSIAGVVGIYSDEPLRPGFFAEYYCLLKHYALSRKPGLSYNVFASQCAAIRREAFFSAGGFSAFPAGVDIENDEFGRRVAAVGRLLLDPRVQVGHHFGGFNKLFYIFRHRVFWWMAYFMKHRRFDEVLATPAAAAAAVSAPLSLAAFLLALSAPPAAGPALLALSALLLLVAAAGHAGFIGFCLKKKGALFSALSAVWLFLFSFVIVFGALEAVVYSLFCPADPFARRRGAP